MSTPAQREKRRQPRYILVHPARVSDAARKGEGEISFDTRDLSVGGAFLRSDLLFEIGEELQLQLDLPDGVFNTRGRVVHVIREPEEGSVPGMGIAFEHLGDRDRERLRSFVTTAR